MAAKQRRRCSEIAFICGDSSPRPHSFVKLNSCCGTGRGPIFVLSTFNAKTPVIDDCWERSNKPRPSLPAHTALNLTFLFFYHPARWSPQLTMQRGTSDISLICRQPDIYAILKLIWHHCFGCRVNVAGGIKGLCPPKTDGGVFATLPSEEKKQKMFSSELLVKQAKMCRGPPTDNSCCLDDNFCRLR